MFSLFAYPLALAALATAPALVAVYYFKNRFRKKTVSSLMLWRFQTESAEGGRKVERAQFPWIFFLELLTLLTLAFAAAGPRWKTERTTRPLILILDNSLSMQAKPKTGPSILEQGREMALKLFTAQAPAPARLILAGANPESMGGFLRSTTELENALESWKGSSASGSLDQAITLATELGGGQSDICVITDQSPTVEIPESGRLRWISVGRPLPNLAIVNATRTPNGEQDRVFLEIANNSSLSSSVNTSIFQAESDQLLQKFEAELAGGERKRWTLNLPQTLGAIRISIGDDSLVLDNEVHLAPPVREKTRVRLVIEDELAIQLVESALQATGLVELNSAQPELTIFAGNREFIESQWDQIGGSWNWIIEFPENPKALAGPFLKDPSSPFLESLELQGILWAGPEGSDTDQEFERWPDENDRPRAVLLQPVLFAGQTPLMLVGVRNGTNEPWIHTRLDITQSSISYSPNWPILVQNMVDARRSAKPGPVDPNLKLGSVVNLKWERAEGSGQWRQPDGEIRELELNSPTFTASMNGVGLNQFVRLGAESGTEEESYWVAVNTLNPRESNLSDLNPGEWGGWDDTKEARVEYSSLLWILALCGLILVALHLFALSRQSNTSQARI